MKNSTNKQFAAIIRLLHLSNKIIFLQREKSVQ